MVLRQESRGSQQAPVASFDHLISAGEERGRDRRARGPWPSFRLMTSSNFVGCLHRKVAEASAPFKMLVNVDSRSAD